MTPDADYHSAVDLLAGLRAGRVSSVELVSRALARCAEINPRFNAIVSLDAPGALARARAADEKARSGQFTGPLHGLPVTIKDCLDVAGLPAVNGAPELRDNRPGRHAVVVQRVVDAGAIVIGKSNVPLYSLDLQTFNEVFGVTRNPWDPGRTPGGSSGGAAVALATGVTSLEIGSDLAGSLRIPAHFTGVCSHKPSAGIVPSRGLVATAPGRLRTPDLSVIGPMARTVADLRLLLALIAGPGPGDDAAWRLELPPPRSPAAGLRVAAWLDDTLCPVDGGVTAVLENVCRLLKGAGVEPDPGARPAFQAGEYFRAFFQLMYGEMSAGLPQHVYRSFSLAARRGTGGEPWTPLAAMPAAVTQSHREWLGVCELRERFRQQWAEFFTKFDVLITPVSPTTAFPHDPRDFELRSIRLAGQDYAYMQQSFWCALATVAGLPAASVPAGLDPGGMPVGLQVIGPFLGDETVLEFAGLVERLTGGFVRPPVDPAGSGHPGQTGPN